MFLINELAENIFDTMIATKFAWNYLAV